MAMIYCRECGRKYSTHAKACPKCGYRAWDAGKSITLYLIFAWFFGIFGVHKFYIGRNDQGIAMLLMGTIGWLIVLPGIAVCFWALIDFIIGICNIKTPEKIFNDKK